MQGPKDKFLLGLISFHKIICANRSYVATEYSILD
jgi:hypothetical protein